MWLTTLYFYEALRKYEAELVEDNAFWKLTRNDRTIRLWVIVAIFLIGNLLLQ